MADDHSIRRPYFLSREAADRCETVLRIADGLEPDVREIARLADTVDDLQRRVLQAANAPTWGLTKSIRSVEQAVAFLGARRVHEIARRLLVESHWRA